MADDFRIEMRFTVVPGSRFAHDLHQHLERSGMRVVDWSEATGENFDLAISPNSNGKLHELSVGLLTLPHGAGHHKYRPTNSGFSQEVSGLSRVQLTHDGRVVPAIIGVSHHEQLDVLRQTCPEALPRARVIGDPCYDRLRESLPMRAHYRRELDIDTRKLVLVNSTWGPDSLFGRQPELAGRLVEELPEDRYRVALVLHPNIWSEHSEYQIRQWTTRARTGGLLLVPPEHGWQATLIAADSVISDHGSLSFYSMALGKPLILAEFGGHEIVADSPMSELHGSACQLDPLDDPAKQIDNAQPVPGDAALAARAFASPGTAAARLRRVIYEQLQLPEPDWEARTAPVELYVP